MATIEKWVVCTTFVLSVLASIYSFHERRGRKTVKAFSWKDWFLTTMPFLVYLCYAIYIVATYR
ncbi:MAG: hypothetical protein AMXMBFR16_00360 [Candidatus Uhrbacteria bacterium]|nr:MAG: hypothetical protein DCC77_05155 [Candidatus Uhrbacteria bacterium]